MRRNPRLRYRNLFALGTFLVPLAVLALLGWNELRRSGQLTEAALEREARQFLTLARAAIEQHLELQLPPTFAASQRLMVPIGPVRTAIKMRDEEGFEALRNIVLVDAVAGVAQPTLAPFPISLPGSRDPQGDIDSVTAAGLSAADVYIEEGDWNNARQRLVGLIEMLDPLGRRRRSDLDETEVHARFRLAAMHRADGETEAAREQFTRVRDLALRYVLSHQHEADMPAFALVAETALAELGAPEERIELLRAIARSERDSVADGMSTALANRLSATFATDSPHRREVDALLKENRQRVATREFATAGDPILRYLLRRRPTRGAGTSDGDDTSDDAEVAPNEHTVITLDDRTSVLAVRPATDEERSRWPCTHVCLELDFRTLLEPALAAFVAPDGNYVLAVSDLDNVVLVPPPETVPEGFTPPTVGTSDLTLRAYPANADRLMADRRWGTNMRTLLLAVLFVAALAGALWSWRSASREAQLAALKIDLLSRVSHELKTPLALIRMYGETVGMGRTRDAAQSAEFGSIIVREADRLTTLIQRILDFSRQQNETLSYSAEPHDLGELVREIAYAYAPHLESKGVVLVDELPLGLTVACDKSGLESAIVNLLENAAKYGPDEGDEHEVELVLQRRPGIAVVEVRDRGRGIPADERRRVFEGFYRASNSGEVRGAGLGLGIVQHFARSHGGDIEALPRDGGGTIMRLTLPLTQRGGDAESDQKKKALP